MSGAVAFLRLDRHCRRHAVMVDGERAGFITGYTAHPSYEGRWKLEGFGNPDLDGTRRNTLGAAKDRVREFYGEAGA